MSRLVSALLILLFGLSTYSQSTTEFEKDLDRLLEIMKKLPSFRDQVRSEKIIRFNQLVDSIRAEARFAKTDFEHFSLLSMLFHQVKDNHLGFYQVLNEYPDQSKFTDPVFIEKYKSGITFKQFPSVSINIDSLEATLNRKPADSIEGIYRYGNLLTIGLYRTKNPSYLEGIVIASSLPHWEKGQLAARLFEYQPACFRAIYAEPVYKYFVLYANEKFKNHSLINSRFYSSAFGEIYKKKTAQKDFSLVDASEAAFQFRKLNKSTQYIRLRHFSAQPERMAESQRFYDEIKDSLNTRNLVVDLRNNTGGAYKVSNKFVKLIRGFAKNGNVYVLINNRTISQGEIVSLQLKEIQNVKLLGQTTNGMLAYGSNYGKTETLPSQKIKVYITDMRTKKIHLLYEDKGIDPDITLHNNSDWLQQVMALIEEGSEKK
jgi:hypothetical protein